LGEWTFLTKLELPDAKLDQIQARFGGGKYRVEIMDGETGRRKHQRTFRIAGRSKNDDDSDATTAKPEIAQRMERLEQLLAERDNPPARNESLGMADVLRLALTALTTKPAVDPLMTTLITALLNGRPSSAGLDPLKLQEIIQSAESKGYEQGKALGEALAGGSEGDGVARVLATTLPSVVDAFKQSQMAYVNRGRALPAPATAAANPAPEMQPATEGDEMSWINALKPAVPLIRKWARDGKDARIKAANTIDDLSDTIRDVIAVQAEDENFVASVIAAIPEFQQPDVNAWVVLFLETVQDILAPGDGDDEPGEPLTTTEQPQIAEA
jgi:hypothetical protein